MADWFQVAAIGSMMFRMGRGLYEPDQVMTRPMARGPHPKYTVRVEDPNKTEVLHGPMHVIRTQVRASQTVAAQHDILTELKSESFKAHCVSCAKSIIYSRGRDEMVVKTDFDEDGTEYQYEERITKGSGLLERLHHVPYVWGMDAKWRLRYYRPGTLLRHMSNMQLPHEDCVCNQWYSAFRVEIIYPTRDQHRDEIRYWDGYQESVEYNIQSTTEGEHGHSRTNL